ncbi:MAG TPA: gliding motility protein GldC [Hanamia sp.]|nr:gliding motility protein GldC [Hanamia sp.]
MTESNININVLLDAEKVPQQIKWNASESSADSTQVAKAMVLAFWDSADKSALRIDLWTKDMMTDEMADFYFQIFVTMADTFQRATRHEDLAGEIKKFANDFHKKFVAKENAGQ